MSDTLEHIELDDTILDDAERLHIVCCDQERVFCDAPYHPEAAAPIPTEDDELDERCPECVDVIRQVTCPRGQVHIHCPFQLTHICHVKVD